MKYLLQPVEALKHLIIIITNTITYYYYYYYYYQDDLIVRKPERDEVGSEVNTRAALEDVGHNADLYIAIQEDNMQN